MSGAARRAFSLSLKSKHSATKEEGESSTTTTKDLNENTPSKPPKSPLRSAKASTSQHPLASQQQREVRDPISSTSSSHLTTSTPDTSTINQHSSKSSKDASIGSLSASDNSDPGLTQSAPDSIGRKRTPSDASTGMQATSSWFSSAVTDEDDDDENDEPVSPADTEWERDSSSLLERAKEALASSEHYQTKTNLKMPERPFLQDIVERGRTKEFSGEDIGNKTTPTSQSPHKDKEPKQARRAETLPTQPDAFDRTKDSKIHRSASKSGSSGILGRLKRISRREKRASTMDEKLREGPFSMLPTATEVKNDENLTSSPDEEDDNTAANGTNNWQLYYNTNREFINGGGNIQYPDRNGNRDIYAVNGIKVIDPKLGILQNIKIKFRNFPLINLLRRSVNRGKFKPFNL